MKTIPKSYLNGTAGQQITNVLIKQELAEDSQAPDLANQEVRLDVELIGTIKTEADPHHTDADAHAAVQEFTPIPQTDDNIKAELILDEEFRDKMSGSEANWKDLALPVADDQEDNLNIQMHSKHLDKAQSIGPFKCGFCSLTFKRKCVLKIHLSTHGEDGEKVFRCDLCKATFSNKHSLGSHRKAHAKKCGTKFKAPTFFICEICGSSFKHKVSLQVHMLRKHLDRAQFNASYPQTADDDFIDSDSEEFLEERSARYGQASSQISAQRSESKSDMKSEACEVCHKIYPKELIRIHMRLEHAKPKYKCEVCSRLFKSKSHLEKHLNTHATDRKREFTCDVCEREFYSKYSMTHHKKFFAQKVHPKFYCQACESSFPKKGDLDVHMRTKHTGKSQPITSDPQPAKVHSVHTKKESI